MIVQEAYNKLSNSIELKQAALLALKSGDFSVLKENGIDLTSEQIIDYFKKQVNNKVEFSEDELENIAGGFGRGDSYICTDCGYMWFGQTKCYECGSSNLVFF